MCRVLFLKGRGALFFRLLLTDKNSAYCARRSVAYPHILLRFQLRPGLSPRRPQRALLPRATGVRDYVAPLAKCAVSAGADGLMIETHPCPEKALSFNCGQACHLADHREPCCLARLFHQAQPVLLKTLEGVSVTESYKLANKKFHPEQTVVRVGNASIGGDEFTIMSGPCAVESAEQVLQTAKAISYDTNGYSLFSCGNYRMK